MRIEIDINGNITEHQDAPITPLTIDQIITGKWALVNNYELLLTITLINGNKYACNKNARLNIIEARDSLLGIGTNATEIWIEEWGTFTTTAIELQEVLDTAVNLIRTYRNLVFGV